MGRVEAEIKWNPHVVGVSFNYKKVPDTFRSLHNINNKKLPYENEMRLRASNF